MKRTLIQSATIITMDDRIGDVRDGDVLVENGRISEVRPGIELGSGAAEAEIMTPCCSPSMPSTAPARLANYDAHKAFLSDTSRFGVKIVMSGPLVAVDGATMIGSLFLIEAPGRTEIEAFNRADPFAAAGIWDKVTITGFLRRQG